MTIELNHTIVWSRDKRVSSDFLTSLRNDEAVALGQVEIKSGLRIVPRSPRPGPVLPGAWGGGRW